jgi:DNA polymerase III delta prime subunit
MADAAIPVLWLCGPPGVGKSTASWQLYTELADSGVPAAFADTDQLRICYPAPAEDPGRQHVMTLNAAAVIRNFRIAGARCAIVNGALGPAGLATGLLPDARVTLCRLRASPGEVERRLTARDGHRDGLAELLREVRDEIRLMDASSFADACVDTTGVPAVDVPGLVRAACADWPGFTGRVEEADGQVPVPPGPAGPPAAGPAAGGRVALITGPPGVGKSTTGFCFYLKCLGAGLTAGYVDLAQVGFLRPAAAADPGGHRLKARNLAAIWRHYRAAGATHLVVTGMIASPADLRLYTDELQGADIAHIRLRAASTELTRRIMARGAGGSWPEPGDRLGGQPAGFLASAARQAVQAAASLDQSDVGGLAVDTTDRSPDDAASMIRQAVGWP